MEKKKKLLVLTGGGDCPGLNAVIRAISKRCQQEKDWELYGSIEGFNGIFKEPHEIMKLTSRYTSGIHVRGGTILKTTNKGNPSNYAIPQADGKVKYVDRTEELAKKIIDLGFQAVINIGGDGSQRISQALFKRGLNIIGIPKTIDNDLLSTDFTFGFQTAVQIATDSFDKLVTTAESHNRVMIMEVMGRDAGWIALHTAIAGGAEVCLIPEIPYNIDKVVERINSRYKNGRGFANIVISEGARISHGEVTATTNEVGSEHVRLGGVAFELSKQLKKAGCVGDIRETVLGHVQRGGSPIAFDRVLATSFGVCAFELILEKKYGRMLVFKNNTISSVSLEEATKSTSLVDKTSLLVKVAEGLGISFGE